jgi:hypothetical protein
MFSGIFYWEPLTLNLRKSHFLNVHSNAERTPFFLIYVRKTITSHGNLPFSDDLIRGCVTMSLCLLNRFEERERSPKKHYAIYERDGRRWWLTLTIHINREAERTGEQCIENEIFAIKKPSKRKSALTTLFQLAIDFSKVPYMDNTITRVRLQTSVKNDLHSSNEVPISAAIRHPLQPFMGVSLANLHCMIGHDDTSAIPYLPAQIYYERYPALWLVRYEDLVGICEKNKLHEGVYRVRCSGRDDTFVYKEPNIPDDVKSQRNEIESLVNLSSSQHVINLQGLVASDNPYLTDSVNPTPPVVRGLLLQYAPRGNLSEVLGTDLEIDWNQRVSWAMQITAGLEDIHNSNIPHMLLSST